MLPRPHLAVLVSTGLLFGLLGCSKHDPDAISGSYKLDGVARSCQAQARTYIKPATNVPAEEYVEISLTTVPQPASGAQVLVLGYHRQVPNGSYIFDDIRLYNNGTQATFYYLDHNGGITPTKFTGFVGTFSATLLQAGGNSQGPFFEVSEGEFANVRL